MEKMKNKMFVELEAEIKKAYIDGVSQDRAEMLAGKFLHAQLMISDHIKKLELDRRMRKRGLKALKSAIRTAEIEANDKKPSENVLEDCVNLNEGYKEEEKAFDEAQVNVDDLERMYGIFKDGHVFFRGIAKGRFEG